MLSGYKTYILAAAGAAVTAAFMLGWIDRSLYEGLLGLLGFGTAAALRSGVENNK